MGAEDVEEIVYKSASKGGADRHLAGAPGGPGEKKR